MMVWLFAFLLVLAAPRGAAAQVPDTTRAPADAPPDTAPEDAAREDTVAVPIPPEQIAGDTIPEELQEEAEAPTPAVRVPRFAYAPGIGWAAARWEWNTDELARLPGMTLLEFIELIPGIVGYRPGGFGRPEGLTALGMGGARVRVFLDGYELDPHTAGSFPLQTISLLDLSRVRVLRTASEIRVDVQTFELDQAEPASVVELGTGVYQTRLLRALFSRGFGSRSIGTGVFDLTNTGGIGIDERYSHFNGVVRWDYALTDRTGLRFEWRRTSADRKGTEIPLQLTRGDLILRARAAPTDAVTLEGYVGRATTTEEMDPFVPPNVRTTQYGGRAEIATDVVYLSANARARSGPDTLMASPNVELEAVGSLQPARFLRIEGRAAMERGQGESATSLRTVGTLTPFPAFSLFASAETGSRFAPRLSSTIPTEGADLVRRFDRIVVDAGGFRAGAEINGAGGALGVAAFRAGSTTSLPFSLPFDLNSPPVDVGESSGLEGYFRLPIPGTRRMLQLDGWYTRFDDAETRPYTPDEVGRVAILFHGLFFDGQLEPLFRLEGIHRGQSLVPSAPGAAFDLVMPAFRVLNFSMQVRILDVRAFVIWDNVLVNREAVTLPGAPVGTSRIVYGASWRFRN